MNELRPIVFDYDSPSDFLRALASHYRERRGFSLRQRAKAAGGVSQPLISQILSGQRRLKRDHLPSLAHVFKLTRIELEQIDRALWSGPGAAPGAPAPKERAPAPRNHLLSSWLHPYVKDLVNLRGFVPEARALTRLLHGVANEAQVARSIDFLLREGFWRRGLNGSISPDDGMVTTTNGIPDRKIRAFHKRALAIAARGLEAFPPGRRFTSTVTVSVSEESATELNALLESFRQRLNAFIDEHPQGDAELVQITLHLTPIGGRRERV